MCSALERAALKNSGNKLNNNLRRKLDKYLEGEMFVECEMSLGNLGLTLSKNHHTCTTEPISLVLYSKPSYFMYLSKSSMNNRVAQLVELLPHCTRDPGVILTSDHVTFLGCSGFPSHPKDVQAF